MHFIQWESLNSNYNFMEVYSWRYNWHEVSIVLGNSLAPNRPQATDCTNDGLVNWAVYVLLGLYLFLDGYYMLSSLCPSDSL